ncbi:Protein phosphatase 1D [Blattella germanica]|nr:Protein phosphatase 1D [Blattella germanica]
MAPSIGVNLRVTGHCSQGGRKYMEDMFSVAYQQTEDEKDLEYAFFGIFDGHGGREAATFAKEHLMDCIVSQKGFWSDKDEDVLRAIRDGFLQTHLSMWGQLESWPKTASGLPSTSGTTASIAFIRKGKIYIGHVGDSSIVLGYQEEGETTWKGRPLTRDHKPESVDETARITQSGGKVVSKSGVPRVVWNRPRLGHRGPVRRSTHIDEIPFLAVARSLGDLWSYNSELDQFVVSPEPDVGVINVEVGRHRCLIFGTDGLWNMLSPNAAVAIVQSAEKHNEKHVLQQHNSLEQPPWINPSKNLVDRALDRWSATRLRADNTSVVTLMLDPPGPPRSQVLLNQKQQPVEPPPRPPAQPEPEDYDPTGGVAIFTRYPVAESPDGSGGRVCKVAAILQRESKVQIHEVTSTSFCKRRHSSVARLMDPNSDTDVGPCPKRRTRSEDKRLSAPPTDDELNASDVENERVTWPSGQWLEDRKARLVKKRVKLPSFLVPRRTLRSDTASTSRTLRSRNVNMEKSSLRKTRQACWNKASIRTRK